MESKICRGCKAEKEYREKNKKWINANRRKNAKIKRDLINKKKESIFKKCRECGENKNLLSYYNKNQPLFSDSICKCCSELKRLESQKIAYGKYYEKNKDKINAKKRANERGKNLEKKRAYARKEYIEKPYKKQYDKDAVENLSDSYIKKKLKRGSGITEFPSELVELKRVQIQIIRHLKETA